MKKVLFLLIVLTIILVGCNSNVKDNENYEYYSYKGYFFDFNVVEKISKKDQINTVLNRINNLTDEVTRKLTSYDDDYFAEKDLIIVYFPLGSGSITSDIEQFKISNTIDISIKLNIPEVGTTDMSGYIYFIETEKSSNEIKVYINDSKNKKELENCEFNKTYKVIDVSSNDGICQVVELKSINGKQKYKTTLCYKNHIWFEENEFYKFTFSSKSNTQYENTIENLLKYFNIVRIEKTEEIVNEPICSGKNERYELITDLNSCINCYKKLYEFEDGTRVYTSCLNIKYKTKNMEISIQEALDKKLLTLSDLIDVQYLKIVEPNEDKPLSCFDD